MSYCLFEWYKWAAENKVPGISVVDQGSAISCFNSVRNTENTIVVSGVGLNMVDKIDGSDVDPWSLNAWAINNKGYNNLIKLASIGYDCSSEIMVW